MALRKFFCTASVFVAILVGVTAIAYVLFFLSVPIRWIGLSPRVVMLPVWVILLNVAAALLVLTALLFILVGGLCATWGIASEACEWLNRKVFNT